MALHQGELCFKTMGSNPNWVLLSGKPSHPCRRCTQKGESREQALHRRVYWSSGTWRRARFGRRYNLHQRGLGGGDNGAGGADLDSDDRGPAAGVSRSFEARGRKGRSAVVGSVDGSD